jgi:hypothetical protein
MDRERCLFLAYSLLFRRQRSKVHMAVLITYSESLRAHDSSEPFSDDMQALTIFSSWSSRVQMMILSTYSGSLQKINPMSPFSLTCETFYF